MYMPPTAFSQDTALLYSCSLLVIPLLTTRHLSLQGPLDRGLARSKAVQGRLESPTPQAHGWQPAGSSSSEKLALVQAAGPGTRDLTWGEVTCVLNGMGVSLHAMQQTFTDQEPTGMIEVVSCKPALRPAPAPAIANPGHKRVSFQPTNNREGEAATVRAHQKPTTQHHPPPAAGQNTRGAVKKGQEASADHDSPARARKITQAIKATWSPPRRYGTYQGSLRPGWRKRCPLSVG
eukprot:1013871-Pelagomonas_calceolata.AAC.2